MRYFIRRDDPDPEGAKETIGVFLQHFLLRFSYPSGADGDLYVHSLDDITGRIVIKPGPGCSLSEMVEIEDTNLIFERLTSSVLLVSIIHKTSNRTRLAHIALHFQPMGANKLRPEKDEYIPLEL